MPNTSNVLVPSPKMLIMIIAYFVAIIVFGVLASKKENKESMKDFALSALIMLVGLGIAIPVVLNKYFNIELGKAMSVAGMCIALSSAFVYDSKTVVLSVLGTYLNGLVLDNFIFNQSVKRRVCIVSDQSDDIRNFILKELHSGASIYQCYGALHMIPRQEIITIVSKSEYQKLMAYLQKKDPKAFVTVYKVSDMRYTPKAPTYGDDAL